MSSFANFFGSDNIFASSETLENCTRVCNIIIDFRNITDEEIIFPTEKFRNKMSSGPDNIPFFVSKNVLVFLSHL